MRTWDARKDFFNADIQETIYAHPGPELCPTGFCWWLHKALYGTRMASQLGGELQKAAFDDAGVELLRGTQGGCHVPPSGGEEVDDGTMSCHGDDFMAEGHEETLDEIDDTLNQPFEVTGAGMIGPGRAGALPYLKRTIGYAEPLPETGLLGFGRRADSKRLEQLVERGRKRGSKPAPTPGT